MVNSSAPSNHVCPYASALSDDEESSHASEHQPLESWSSSDGADATNARRQRAASDALSLARSKCPAFADNACPFRNSTNPEALRDVMKTVPPSHFPSSSSKLRAVINSKDSVERGETPFQLAMEHVHRVSSWLSSGEEEVEGAAASSAAVTAVSSVETPSSAAVLSTTRKDFIVPGGCPFKSFHVSRAPTGAVVLAKAMEDYSLAAIMSRMANESFEESDSDSDIDSSDRESFEVEKLDGGEANEISETLKLNLEETGVEFVEPMQKPVEKQKVERRSLSEALKTGTAESHEAAENVYFVKNFVKGEIDRDLYAQLVTGLYHSYVTLENLLDVHAPHHFPSLHFPKELRRTPALEEDMEFWHGTLWRTKLECRHPSPAVREYVARMEEAAKIDPLLLLSHAYTRYLGDLSGGKVLSRIARRALTLDGYDGLQFYHFEHIKSAKVFKDKYRTAMDDLSASATELSPERMGRIVAEANVAFALNMRVFEELDVAGGVEGAYVRDVGEALVYYDRVVEKQAAGETGLSDVEEAKCPFGFVGGPNPHAPKAEVKKQVQVVSSPSPTDAFSTKSSKSEGRCPWPFVFMHDPATGMKDWQTWLIIGLVSCWVLSRISEILLPSVYLSLPFISWAFSFLRFW